MRSLSMVLAVLLPGVAASAPAPSAQVEVRIEAVAPRPADDAPVPPSREDAPAPPVNTVSLSGYALQPPGNFHGDEVLARDGERWLALRVDGDDAALVPATLRVAGFVDLLVDEAGEATGKAVTTEPADTAIRMFLRGPALVAGHLDHAPGYEADGDGRHRIDQVLALGDARYRLRSECTRRDQPPREGQVLFDCRIVLRELGGRGRDQLLVRMDGYAEAPGAAPLPGNDAMPALLFAGDLDRDGELDLLFDTTDHYNISRPTLFLSSQAGPGELLGEAARYESVGC